MKPQTNATEKKNTQNNGFQHTGIKQQKAGIPERQGGNQIRSRVSALQEISSVAWGWGVQESLQVEEPKLKIWIDQGGWSLLDSIPKNVAEQRENSRDW